MPSDKVSVSQITVAIEAAGASWQAGVTSMSILPPQAQKARLGVTPPPGTPDPGTVKPVTGTAASASSVAAPASFFWGTPANNNYVTPVTDQGGCGSCVAFGSTAVAESMVRIHYGDPSRAVDLSEAQLFFCLGPASGASCSAGWWPTHAYDAYQATGVTDEACFPYDAAATACNECSDWANRVTKITGYQDLTNNPAAIKNWIANTGPVSACFYVYDDFFSYTNGIYSYVTGNLAGGHCVSIVGYDDVAGYWMCKNSWGTGWGEQGYFCIAYGQCNIETWGVFGVSGIQDTGWRNGVHVIGLWAINQDRNAWAYIDGYGWRKISPDNDNILHDMLAQLIAAKAKGGTITALPIATTI